MSFTALASVECSSSLSDDWLISRRSVMKSSAELSLDVLVTDSYTLWRLCTYLLIVNVDMPDRNSCATHALSCSSRDGQSDGARRLNEAMLFRVISLSRLSILYGIFAKQTVCIV